MYTQSLQSCFHLHINCTWSIRDGPDKRGQHLHCGRGAGVPAEPVLHLPAEPVHDVLERLIGEPHGVQVLINLRNRHGERGPNWMKWIWWNWAVMQKLPRIVRASTRTRRPPTCLTLVETFKCSRNSVIKRNKCPHQSRKQSHGESQCYKLGFKP